jgi:hypothetical protein
MTDTTLHQSWQNPPPPSPYQIMLDPQLTLATLWTSQWYNNSPKMETSDIGCGMLPPLDSYTTLYGDCSSLDWWNMQTHHHGRSQLYQHPLRQDVSQLTLSRIPLAQRDLVPVEIVSITTMRNFTMSMKRYSMSPQKLLDICYPRNNEICYHLHGNNRFLRHQNLEKSKEVLYNKAVDRTNLSWVQNIVNIFKKFFNNNLKI